MPALRDFQAPATFFLSGRALHADEPYWFQHLEALLIARGVRQTAALLGMPDAQPGAVLAACEGSARRAQARSASWLATSLSLIFSSLPRWHRWRRPA